MPRQGLFRDTGWVSGTDDDDDALSWAGARDPSLYETPTAKAPSPSKAAKSGTPESAAADSALTDDDEIAPGMSGVVLVCLGILGGIYALYTIGWFVSWQRLLYSDSGLGLAAFHIQQALAVLAAPLWFTVTLLATRDRKPTVRLLWLVIGALLLVPWSFTFGQ
jgi:hypothetical protein